MSEPLVIVIVCSCLCLTLFALILGSIVLYLLFVRPASGPSGCVRWLFPLPRPERTKITLLPTTLAPPKRGRVRLELAPPAISQIRLVAPRATALSDNLCPATPDRRQLDLEFSPSLFRDLTPSIAQQAPAWSDNLCLITPDQRRFDFRLSDSPAIESLLDLLVGRGLGGKAYDAQSTREEPQPIGPEDLQECRHGLPKATCALCQEERQRRQKRQGTPKPRIVNPFDLLLPFLYPPLGANFDNAIVFPPGKDLFGFQREGIRFLATHEAALLADEMGLGKSIQAIVATRLLLRSSDRPMTALILCPKSVLKDWQRKLEEWAPELRTLLVSGSPELRSALWQTLAHVHLANYDVLWRDRPHANNGDYDIVILDEVQSIKNPGAQRTKAVRKIKGRRRWALSATPMENKIEDLVSVFAYLKPGLLRYEDAKSSSTIQHKIKPYFLRRKVEKVKEQIGLGDKVSRIVWLELTPEQRETYDRLVEASAQSLRPESQRLTRLAHQRARSSQDEQEWRKADFQVRGQALTLIGRLKQVCNFDPETGQSCKADFIRDQLEALREMDEKALVFSQYPNLSLRPLAQRLDGFELELFDGALSASERDRLIQEFQDKDDTLALLMSLKAGGLGITLTRANHVFHLDHWWNPAVTEQAVGRVYRVGQKKPVFVTSLYVTDTIEERIYRKLEHKRELFRQIIDDLSDEKIVGSLSTEELLELFDLVTFSVRLVDPGSERGKVVRAVSEIAGLESLEARERVYRFPSTILQNASSQEAERAKIRLEAAGAEVKILSSYSN